MCIVEHYSLAFSKPYIRYILTVLHLLNLKQGDLYIWDNIGHLYRKTTRARPVLSQLFYLGTNYPEGVGAPHGVGAAGLSQSPHLFLYGY